MPKQNPKYQRMLLKLSGESLMGDRDYGIDDRVLRRYAEDIKSVREFGVQVGIVIGGGNIYRGVENSSDGIDKVTGDHMGMLATVINALDWQSSLQQSRCNDTSLAGIDIPKIAEPFIRA